MPRPLRCSNGSRPSAAASPCPAIAGRARRGAPYRLIVDSGIPHALHQDGVHIAPLNPWFALYYATTGINFAGQQTNPGQSITRLEALRAFTRGAAWYMSREDDLGSIEVGKLGDLVVLDKDYFTVSDAEMRRIEPVLTVVGGRVLHDAGVVG